MIITGQTNVQNISNIYINVNIMNLNVYKDFQIFNIKIKQNICFGFQTIIFLKIVIIAKLWLNLRIKF